jgi:hypothetical protein
MSDDTARQLFENLILMPRLEYLDVRSNKICLSGFAALVSNFNHSKLIYVFVSRNPFVTVLKLKSYQWPKQELHKALSSRLLSLKEFGFLPDFSFGDLRTVVFDS